MNCAACLPLLDAYLDGELDARGCAEIEAHLDACRTCTARLASGRDLSQAIRAHATRHVPPEGLARALRLPVTPARSSTGSRRSWARPAWVAAACAASLLVGGLSASLLSRAYANGAIADEVVAAHVRSLQVDHLVDVASSDRHTVTPWFQGKLPFAVPARDLSDRGFALEGGRLDFIDAKPVAALAYRHGPHAINVFVWPADGEDKALEVEHLRGYALLHWTHGSLQRWIVSDADEKALVELAPLIQ